MHLLLLFIYVIIMSVVLCNRFANNNNKFIVCT